MNEQTIVTDDNREVASDVQPSTAEIDAASPRHVGLDSVAARLRHAREAAGFRNSTDFCRAQGLRHNTYDHHETGRRGIKLQTLKDYASMLRVNLAWLVEGEGQMRTNDWEMEVLDLARTMTPDQVRAWIAVGRVMVNSNPRTNTREIENGCRG